MPVHIPEIYQIAETFKAAIARREGQAAAAMVRQYGRIFEVLQKKLAAIRERILAAGDAGEEISPAWLFRQDRYHTLLAEVAAEMRRFAIYASDSISELQRDAVQTALDSVDAQFEGRGLAASWSRLPAAEVEQQVGFVSAGPLKTLLDQIGPDARERVSALLVEAVSLGYNPRKVAQKIQSGLKGALAGGLTRALRIARTETMRAYREATHHQFSANADILEGWYWVATLGLRTCPACLALHGTFHQLDERQAAHVNCRCTQIAALEGEASPVPQRGPDWLQAQPEKFQRAFFADTPGAFEAYQAGELSLEDFCGRRENRVWGPSYQALTTTQAKAGQGQFPGDAATARSRPATPPAPLPLPRVTFEPEPRSASNLIAELFGPDADRARIAGAAGALDDSVVTFAVEGRRLVVAVKHPELDGQVRHFYKEHNRLVLYNAYFAKAATARPNIGAEMMARQVEFAPGLGVPHLETEAAGSIDSLYFTGYRVWPGYGYDAPIPLALRAELPASLKPARTMLDLYETEEGRLWWKQNGLTLKMKFDLAPGSRSRRVLERRLAAKETT